MTERNVWELETPTPVYRYYWVKLFLSAQIQAAGGPATPVQNMSIGSKPKGGAMPIPLWVGFLLLDRTTQLAANTEMALLETPPDTSYEVARHFLDAGEGAQWAADATHCELLAMRIS